MDTQKDIIEHGGTVASDTKETVSSLSVFHEHSRLSDERLKRTERLSAALYMVTGLIPDAEPIKWKMRERALILLADMSFMREVSVSERVMLTERAHDTVTEIVALLNVALAGDLLSEMNVSILKKEYGLLHELLRKGEKEATAREGFVRDLFVSDVRSLGYSPADERREKYENIKGHLKDTYSRSGMSDIKGHEKDTHVREESPIVSLRNDVSDRTAPASAAMPDPRNTEINQTIRSIKEERRKHIIAIIKKKRHVTIKDISRDVSAVGEKTIQRELAAMVEEGVLKKEGEKRWSTYTLAS